MQLNHGEKKSFALALLYLQFCGCLNGLQLNRMVVKKRNFQKESFQKSFPWYIDYIYQIFTNGPKRKLKASRNNKTARPRILEVETARNSINIQHFAGKIKVLDFFAFKGFKIYFL